MQSASAASSSLDPDLYARIFRPYHGYGRQLFIHGFGGGDDAGENAATTDVASRSGGGGGGVMRGAAAVTNERYEVST